MSKKNYKYQIYIILTSEKRWYEMQTENWK